MTYLDSQGRTGVELEPVLRTRVKVPLSCVGVHINLNVASSVHLCADRVPRSIDSDGEQSGAMNNVHGGSLYEEEVEYAIKIYPRGMTFRKGHWLWLLR